MSETSPARYLWLTLRETRYIMLGPEMSTMPSATPVSASEEGTKDPLRESRVLREPGGPKSLLAPYDDHHPHGLLVSPRKSKRRNGHVRDGTDQ